MSLYDSLRRYRTGPLLAVLTAAAPVPIMMPAGWAADDYPTRPIRLIVPFAAGGNADIVGRIAASGLTSRLGQQVVVDNRPGASSVIGTELVARAAPDGHTLLLIANTFAVNVSTVPKLPYDTQKDFVPVCLIGQTPQVLVVSPGLGVNSVRDLIAYAKAKPATLNYGSTGVGSTGNMAGALFNLMAGVQITHVPYKGTAQALTDAIAGHLQVAIPSVSASLPHIRAGKLRAIGVTSEKRSTQLPDVPTIAEAALPGFQAVIWNGILAPRGTSQPIIARLSRELISTMRAPEATERYRGFGGEAIGSSPEEFAAFIRREIEQYARVVKASGMVTELR